MEYEAPEEMLPGFYQPVELAPVKAQVDVALVKLEDATIMRNVLSTVQEELKRAIGVDDVCKLALTTAKLLSERRKLMLLPAEYKDLFAGNKNRGDDFLDPYAN